MSINPLNDISRVYLEQVAFSEEFVDPEHGESPSGRSPLQNVSDHPKASVRRRAVKGFRKQMEKEYGGKWTSRSNDPVKEALDPVGQEDADIDNDGNPNTKKDKYLLNRRKVRGSVIAKRKEVAEELKGNQKVLDKARPFGKLTAADFKELRKKKSVKEEFSNWREDLKEIVDVVTKEQNQDQIKEKKVNNKIKINPSINLGDRMRESVESLGGTLIEMVEVDEVDFIVESVYCELIEEGYGEDDIEQAIEYALTEATVTFGHDTPTGQKKKSNLLKAVGRLARQKLSSRVRGAQSAAADAIASGARKVAKGALGVARKMEGDKSPSPAQTKKRTASTYRGAGVGTKERVSSGSYQAPTKKKVEKPADPWGSATTPPKSRPEVKQTTTPVKSGTSKRGIKLRQKADEILKQLRTESYDDNIPELRSRTITDAPSSSGKTGKSRTSSVVQMMRQMNVDVEKPKKKKKTVAEETLFEKTLSSAETKKKEEIVKSMKSKLKDFEARYPGRGKEVMYATATKMAQKVAENFIDEAKLSRTEKRARQAEKPSTPKRPRHVVQLDLDQAALREVGSKKLRDPKTGKKQTTKVEPAKINVKGEGGKVVRTVSTGDFHKEKLGKGETMDFSPLRDPKKFTQTTKANKNVINKARGAVVEPNTARGAFRSEEVSLDEKVDNKSVIQHLQNIGYNRKRGMTIKPGHFTGDMPGSGSPGKKLIATKHDIKKYQPQKISHIDDDPKNLEPLEKHRRSTQGERGETRGEDPKIHTQMVGSFRKRGEGRSLERDHGRVRRYSGVRDPGSVTQPKTTSQIQRARKRARRGMGEAVDMNTNLQQPQQQSLTNPQQLSKDIKAKSNAQKAKQAAIAIKTKELAALKSTPAGTSVAGFGG